MQPDEGGPGAAPPPQPPKRRGPNKGGGRRPRNQCSRALGTTACRRPGRPEEVPPALLVQKAQCQPHGHRRRPFPQAVSWPCGEALLPHDPPQGTTPPLRLRHLTRPWAALEGLGVLGRPGLEPLSQDAENGATAMTARVPDSPLPAWGPGGHRAGATVSEAGRCMRLGARSLRATALPSASFLLAQAAPGSVTLGDAGVWSPCHHTTPWPGRATLPPA